MLSGHDIVALIFVLLDLVLSPSNDFCAVNTSQLGESCLILIAQKVWVYHLEMVIYSLIQGLCLLREVLEFLDDPLLGLAKLIACHISLWLFLFDHLLLSLTQGNVQIKMSYRSLKRVLLFFDLETL